MDSKKLMKTLESLGLSQKEAKTYIVLLELGETSATSLARRTGITRTLIYEIMDKLMEKGLVSSVLKEGIKQFSAAEPDILIKQLEEKGNKLRDIMPELKALAATGKKETTIAVYRGKKGVNTVLKMIIEDGLDYHLLGGAKEACSYFEHENKVFVKRVAEAGIKGYILAGRDDELFIGKLESFRYLPAQMLGLTTTAVWGDKIAIFVWSEPYYAMLIDNDKIAQSNLSTFKYLWKTAKKPTKADMKKRMFD
jgi:sugar-specific transcriptional regulator TrmB